MTGRAHDDRPAAAPADGHAGPTRVVVLSPIRTSPFSCVVTKRCHEETGVEVVGVVVRRILDRARVRSEFRRDGVRLVRKVFEKLVLGGELAEAAGERGFEELAALAGVAGTTVPRLCRELAVPCRTVADPNGEDALEWLRELRPDVVVFTGGGILRKPLLELAGAGVLNAHMGILPHYRGMDVVEWPLLEGRVDDVGLGVTLHFMAAGIDTGPILARRRVEIRDGDTMPRLRRRFEPVMVDALLEGVRRVRDGTLEPESQALEDGRQYFVMHPRLVERTLQILADRAGRGGR